MLDAVKPPRTLSNSRLSAVRFARAAVASVILATAVCAQITVGVNLVTIPVTVTDAGGELVAGLDRDNFRLLVDGTEQPIEYFAPEEEPAHVLLLMETGPAVYLLRRGHVAAAASLLEGLAADDRVAVSSYSDIPRLVLDWTTDKKLAAAAIVSLDYGIGMAQLNFYDSLAQAVEWAGAGREKRAIVTLTTGLDGSGAPGWERLTAALRQRHVLVVPVALGGELRGTATQADEPEEPGGALSFAESNRALRAIAEETGGAVFFPRTEQEFAEAYSRIALLLRHQYSLGFAAREQDGAYHSIQVEVVDENGALYDGRERRAEYHVNARRGFTAPTGP